MKVSEFKPASGRRGGVQLEGTGRQLRCPDLSGSCQDEQATGVSRCRIVCELGGMRRVPPLETPKSLPRQRFASHSRNEPPCEHAVETKAGAEAPAHLARRGSARQGRAAHQREI